MTPKVKRKPVRTPKRRPKASKGKGKKLKIRKDPLKEYKESIAKDGVVEVLTLADDDCLANVKLHISTQSLELDRLLNSKGIPTGRVTEFFGPPHIGKSTLLDHTFAEVQKMGGVAVLADTEGARDIRYTQAIGVDPKKLVYLEFDDDQLHIENIITVISKSVVFWSNKYPDMPVVIGWDALAGTATRDELEKGVSDAFDVSTPGKKDKKTKHVKPGAAAKVMRSACRLLPSKLGNTNVAVVICNHEYQNIQMHGRVGKKRETYGGDAVRHLSTLRLQLFPTGEWVKKGDGSIIGREVGAKLVKNRLGNPWGEARFALISGVGVDNVWSIFRKFKDAGVISVSGSWAALNFDGQMYKFQGWQGLLEQCNNDETLFPRLVNVYRSLS